MCIALVLVGKLILIYRQSRAAEDVCAFVCATASSEGWIRHPAVVINRKYTNIRVYHHLSTKSCWNVGKLFWMISCIDIAHALQYRKFAFQLSLLGRTGRRYIQLLICISGICSMFQGFAFQGTRVAFQTNGNARQFLYRSPSPLRSSQTRFLQTTVLQEHRNSSTTRFLQTKIEHPNYSNIGTLCISSISADISLIHLPPPIRLHRIGATGSVAEGG